MLDHFKYAIWPAIKVRLWFLWLLIKYRGKKNIPPEEIFGAARQSMDRMIENLQKALRSAPDGVNYEELQELTDVLEKAEEMREGLNALSREAEKRK